MAKWLRVTMPDQSVWEVPAELVANPRARYYAAIDTKQTSGPEFDAAFAREFSESMSAYYELCDWASNNMNWTDVSDAARKVADTPVPDFQEGWMNGEKELVVHD